MSDSSQRLRFGDFELDESNALLTRAGTPIALPPKAFTLLCVLARQPGKLADKNSLLDAVWGHRFVSESVLKSTVSQVRAALADDAGEPRFIETVSRRGYRFIGSLGASRGAHAAAPSAHAAQASVSGAPNASVVVEPARPPGDLDGASTPPMIGRADALARLRAGWQRALAGQRQLFWVAGEAGIGKTTLVDRLAAEVGAEHVLQGQCVEQFGAAEPYLPILDALKTLCRRDPGAVPVLRKVAPTWLAQMPWLVAEQDRAALQIELAGAGQERMVRELIELGDVYSQRTPMLLITEDLHWADDATLRLMDHFARRRPPIRVMWVATFRLTQVIAEEHPLKALRQELQLHRLSDEVLLDPFSEKEVEEYVSARVHGAVAEQAVKRLHAHTDGLPLFVANVLDGLLVQEADGRARNAGWLETGEGNLPVPDNLVGAIEKQLAKLPGEVRGLLEAASICGMEFGATLVAGLLEHNPAEIAELCDELVRRKYWLADAGVVDLPDGSIDARYTFRHALYKHVFYQRMPAVRRVGYHRFVARAGARREKGAGAPTPAELASHFELGHEYMPAVAQYAEATKNALNSFAPRDAIDLTTHALELLPRCADGPERVELELALLAHRGHAFAHVHGVSSLESESAFNRVREICETLPQTPERALLLNGLGWAFYTRGAFADAIKMSERVHALAEETGVPTLMTYACSLLGITHCTQGRRRAGIGWFEKGIDVCERFGDTLERPLFLLDPEAAMRSNIAPGLAMLGQVDQAREQLRKAIARADRIGQPIARLVAHWLACIVGVLTEDLPVVERHEAKLTEIVRTSGLRQGVGPSCWLRGIIEVRHGRPEAGLALIEEGYTAHASLGMYSGLPAVLSFKAEALHALGRQYEAERAMDEAMALVEHLDERGIIEALYVRQSRIVAPRGDDAVLRCLEQGLLAARLEDSVGAELLVRVEIAARERRTSEDLDALAAVYERAVGARDTPVAERARALLAARGGKPNKPNKPKKTAAH
jgi:DNA-binding winged helix-turn-helix (wHTH) protein/tetratricopeptide (TPR) repeat protein